jgi:hypothetical protein
MQADPQKVNGHEDQKQAPARPVTRPGQADSLKLEGHLYRKSADYTVLDLTGASSSQIDAIFSAMGGLEQTLGAPRSPAIIVGEEY